MTEEVINVFDWFQLASKKRREWFSSDDIYINILNSLLKKNVHMTFIVNQLSQLSCNIETPVGRNGIKATFKGAEDGPTIAFRADFDALPVQELNDVPYRSKHEGCMHACGHDGHTAILLGVAEIVNEHRHLLKGNVVFIFQYGEEIMPGGSQEMIDAGCLQDVDKIYGTHLWSGYPSGTIYSRPGAIMASPDEFSITIQGKGGHGAKPHGND